MASNDVPEYLNELIPYRCPKCGHLRRFATLRELRQHLQSEHSFQMGFVKPHTRAHVFKNTQGGSNSSSFSRSLSSEDLFKVTSNKYGRDTINELRRSNIEYDGSKKFRDTSPLLKSFKEETELLEKELQQARQNEMKHKTLSMHNLTESSVNTDYKKSLEAIQRPTDTKPIPKSTIREYTNSYPANFQTNFVEKTKPHVAPHRSHNGPSYDFKRTLETLNSEVMKSRMNQWVTTDALYRSQDLLKGMEEAAEQKCQEQKGIIEQLMLDMKSKDAMLETRTKQQAELSTERQRLLNETESIVKQTDDYNTRLRHELDGRGKILEGLNTELEKLKTQSEQEIKTKEFDLQNATQKINQLELERERLIQETDGILKRADQDTGNLKKTLQKKEQELKNVNEVLNHLRQQQQMMLERTMTVYRSSEESREIMKTAIQTKDGQLQHAMKQIENMTSLHKRLLEQSQILTDQADDNTSSMKRLLRAKGEQIQDLAQQLDILKREKRHLEENTLSLAEQAESSVSAVDQLRDMVKQKENDLKTTQSELQNLKSFLQSTADKERVARQKLEVFIEELIKRAEQAESELYVLKSQSTQSASTLQDVKIESFSDLHNSESTMRKSLPSKLHLETPKYQSMDVPQTHQSELQQGLTESISDRFHLATGTSLPFQNEVVTTADVHQMYPSGGIDDIRTKIKTEGDDVNSMHFIKGKKLEESGGFVAQENFHGRDSSNLCEREYLTKSYDSVPHRDQSSINKPVRRKKSRELRKRYERSYESSSNEDINRFTDYRKRRKDSDCVKSKGRQYTKGSKNKHLVEAKGSFSDENQSDGHSNTEYYQIQDRSGLNEPAKHGKVNRGLQVGAFLSNQYLDYDVEDDSDNLDTASEEDGSYSDVKYKIISRSVDSGKMHGSHKYIRQDTERPVTMGNSPKCKSTNRKELHNGSRKKIRKTLNRNFDTNLPKSHRSMVDITTDGIDLSEGEVLLRMEERHRRSRSLSPRIIRAKATHQMRNIEQLSGTSEYEDESDDENYVSINENDVVENTDGVFRNIMDDNGILWEDDNATLPDVSDSEFDRISPSGSEALATKNTHNTTTNINSKIKGSPKTATKYEGINKFHKKYSQNDTGKTLNHLLDSQTRSGTFPMKSGTKSYKTEGIAHRDLSSGIKDTSLTETDYPRDNKKSMKVNFRPIKSPLFSKSSTSEKDLSSGGKEVKSIMKVSPKIDIKGASRTDSLSELSSSSRLKNISNGNRNSKISKTSKYTDLRNSRISTTERKSRSPIQAKYSSRITDADNGQYNTRSAKLHSNVKSTEASDMFAVECNAQMAKESIDERIERISNKYSPNHSNKQVKPDGNTSFNLDEKIKSINSKYKVRRNDILQGKGVSPSHLYLTNVERTYNRSRSPSSLSPSFNNTTLPVQNERLLTTGTGFDLNEDKTLLKLGNSHLSSSESATFPNKQHMANSGHPNYAYPPWPPVTDQSNSPYMQYRFPYPPNWNQYPYYPFPPGHPEAVLLQQQLQQQKQQEQQQQQQLLQQHQKENEEVQIQDKSTEDDQKEQHRMEAKFSLIKEQVHQQEQNNQNETLNYQQQHVTNKVDTTEFTKKAIENNGKESNPYNDQAIDLNTAAAKNTAFAKENEIKEYERGHSPGLKTGNSSSQELCLKEQSRSVIPDETDILIYPEQVTISKDEHIQGTIAEVPIGSVTNTCMNEIEQPCVASMSENSRSTRADELSRKIPADMIVPEKISHREISHGNEEIRNGVAINSSVKYPNGTKSGMEEKTVIDLNSELNDRSIGDENDPKLNSGLSFFEDTDNYASSLSMNNKASMFAEEIGEESSAEYDSNTQSNLDLPDGLTDTDIEGDTDTESVRRDFYENTNRIKDLLDGPQNDFSDVYRHKFSRNTTSSASSQASLEILDRIPTAKREQVKQRRAALVCIFSFLDTRTLSRVARVCREWRIVSRSPKLWRRVEIRGEKISPKFLRQISRRCSQLRVLILEDLHPRNRKHDESVEDYQKNIRCSLEIGYEQILKKAEGTLNTIVIVNCGTLFSAKCLWIASCCCRMLKHVAYISDFDPINAEVMWALGSGCRELKTLKCQPIFPCVHADNFTTKCAQLIGKCFRDLEIVSIGGLIVDVNALIFIAKQCQKLKEIEVHQMKFISCDTIDEMCQNGFQSLRSFQFHAAPVAPGALAVLQGNCKHLDAIYIQLTESDFEASITNQSGKLQTPDYHEIIDGYEALKKQPSLFNILTLKIERPKTPQPVKEEPMQERSFFDRLFGKNE